MGMKALFLSITCLFFSCKDPDGTVRNTIMMKGKWYNMYDSSSIEIIKPNIMFVVSDTLKGMCAWYIDNCILHLSYGNLNTFKSYTFIIEELTEDEMILIRKQQHYYT